MMFRTAKKFLIFRSTLVKLQIVCLLTFFSMLISQISIANDEFVDSAINTVNTMSAEIEKILETDIDEASLRAEKVSSLFDKYFNLQKIAQGSVGQYWRTASIEQKREYKILLKEIIVKTVTKNFDKLEGLEFVIQKAEEKGRGLTFVDGIFVDKTERNPDVEVRWLLFQKGDNAPRIVDISIENLSMITTQRQENISVIRRNKGNFHASIEAMKERSQRNEK